MQGAEKYHFKKEICLNASTELQKHDTKPKKVEDHYSLLLMAALMDDRGPWLERQRNVNYVSGSSKQLLTSMKPEIKPEILNKAVARQIRNTGRSDF